MQIVTSGLVKEPDMDFFKYEGNAYVAQRIDE